MAPVQAPQHVDPEPFWNRFRNLITALVKQKAHVEVILTIQDGSLKLIRVNRSFLPGNLPDLPDTSQKT